MRLPSWSPDGKWIAYNYDVQASGSYRAEGLHIMDTQCFMSPSTCVKKDEVGIDISSPYTWSPDSLYIAGLYNDDRTGQIVINVYQWENRKAKFYRTYQLGLTGDKISWSPSGKCIAARTMQGVFLVSLDTGNLTPLGLQTFDYWLKVP